MATTDTHSEIEETFGLVPEFMEVVSEPALDHSWGLLRDLQLGETEIPAKYKTLMGLAVSAALQCPYCVHFSAETAKFNDATEAELREAVNIASTIRYYSTIVNGNALDFDAFADETARIIDHLSTQAVGAAED